MFGGQFYPGQPLQFMDGLLEPPIGGWLGGAPSVVQRTKTEAAARATSTVLAWAAATAGNLIVIEFVCEQNAAQPTTPAGYTAWPSGNLADGGGNQATTIFYKIAAGGETGVTITHGNNVTCSLMREISGTSGVISFGTPSLAVTANPNPPSVTPAGGTKNYLWVAGASFVTGSVSSYSAGYSNGLTAAATSAGSQPRAASAEKQSVGSTEDPGTLTLSASLRSIAYSYAVAP